MFHNSLELDGYDLLCNYLFAIIVYELDFKKCLSSFFVFSSRFFPTILAEMKNFFHEFAKQLSMTSL